jgi:PHS family inorganic phosphate transporter-like MFS transporter
MNAMASRQQPQQLQVLSALDGAKTQWYHFRAIVVAGMGFFTDAYDLFCISLVTKLLGRIYYTDPSSSDPGSLPPNVAAAVNGVALCGTLAGQLFFGWLGDRLGRKSVYGMTLILMVVCSLASGLSFGHTPTSVMATLCFFRFWLGFGIGGDYPLSATIMSEYANKKTRGAFIAAVFAMQGFGILAGGIVTLVLSTVFRKAFAAPAYEVHAAASTVPQADYVWRIILMLGAAPAILTYYWRTKMPETARYTALVAGNAKQASLDMSKVLQSEIEAEPEKLEEIITSRGQGYGLFSLRFAKRHGLHLAGTAAAWFLVDVAYYSQNLFQKDIFSSIGWIPKARAMDALEEVFRISRAQTLIALCGTVPGYWFTVFLIDRIGRFTIQLLGFAGMTAFMLALAVPYHHWTTPGNHVGFVVMYGLTFFFANFGPNATTFIVPAEIFPARLRATCHGISAAAGKAGAIIGAFGFLYAAQSTDPAHVDAGYRPGIGVQKALYVLAACNLLGFLVTFLVPESKGKSLEEMSGEADGEEGGANIVHPSADQMV